MMPTLLSSSSFFSRFSTSSRWALIVLLVLATIFFIVRGPMRSISGSSDLFLIYAASRTWLVGGNPYDADAQQIAVTSANPDDHLPNRAFASLYPPTTFVVMSPVSSSHWEAAKWGWLTINLIAMGSLLVGVLRLAKLTWREPRGTALIGLLLIFSPISTGFNVGQIALVCTAGVVWAVLLQRTGQTIAAGVLLGVMIALKPQIAGLFLLHGVMLRQWRAIWSSLVAVSVLAMLAVIRMRVAEVDWLGSLFNNLHEFSQVGGTGSVDPQNPYRHQLVNLAYPIRTLINHSTTVSIIVNSTIVLMLVAMWRLIRHEVASQQDKVLSFLAVITLMATYHRAYDAVLLVLPLAWALGPGWRYRTGRVLLVLVLVFLLPIPIILDTAARHGLIGPMIVESWVWQTLALPATAWTLPVMAVVLLIRMRPESAIAQTLCAERPIDCH